MGSSLAAWGDAASSSLVVRQFGGPSVFPEEEYGSFVPQQAAISLPSLLASGVQAAPPEEIFGPFVREDEAGIENITSSMGGGRLSGRGGVFGYVVERGDTISHIAKNFGVSVNTILWANEGLRANRLRPGEQIVILPVSGVLHSIREGEVLDDVAAFYGVPAEKIIDANPGILPYELRVGERIVIPGGQPRRTRELAYAAGNLPDLKSYFKIPVAGLNWGELHYRNAVDIANACGTPIYAAAEGLVVKTGNPGNWNSGYGGFIDIEHPNGTATRYAHIQESDAEVGDYVRQGERIAEVGNTGNSHGPTGCHLHFEVEGARNPLAR